MPTDTAAGLVETIRQAQLLEPAQLQELASVLQPRFPDPRALAKVLVKRGWLTPYQVNQIFQGLGPKLMLGPYLLLERLGEGGMGEVFKANHRRLKRIVAVKVIRQERLNNANAVNRFQREVRAAARLDHPNIVHAFDADQIGATFILVMEHVEGTDLSKLVKQNGPLRIEQACDIIRQAALGLQCIHESGLVHRDIKPSNFLVTGKGVVKILDLGLARIDNPTAEESSSTLTETGAVLGTPDFIAPEQARHSKQVDIRADLYSLGCTLHFLLAGKVPFGGDTLGEKLLKQMMDEPAPLEKLRPEVPPGLAGVVRKLMAKRPEDRYQTPKELAEVLQVGLTTGNWPKPPPSQAKTQANRRRAVWLGIGLFLLVNLSILLYLAFRPAGPPAGTGAIVIKDPGFETPSVGVDYQYGPSGSPWTFTSGVVSNGSGLTGNGNPFTKDNPNAPEGTQVAFLQGAGGTISQSVTFVAGTYAVHFLAAQRGSFNHSEQTFRVLVDGKVVGTFTPSSTSYAVHQTAAFTVTAGPHTLTFEGQNPKDGDNTAFIDMVSVQRAGIE